MDKKNRSVRFNAPERMSNSRILTISSDLINMLEKPPNTNEYIFGSKKIIASF